LSTGSTNPRKRSWSVEAKEDHGDIADVNCVATSFLQVPATLEEARDRIQVLSALTEIAGGKRRSQVDQNLLKISVVTQTDQRIETGKRTPRSDLFEDYHGSKCSPEDNPTGSSGGL
jgi:hypothetical protein